MNLIIYDYTINLKILEHLWTWSFLKLIFVKYLMSRKYISFHDIYIRMIKYNAYEIIIRLRKSEDQRDYIFLIDCDFGIIK